MSVICSNFLLKLALGTEIFLKLSHASILFLWTKEIQATKQQYTVTLFDCNHLAHVIVLKQMQKIMSYCTVFALLYFECEGYFPSIGPRGWYLEGLFIGGFFCVSSLGRLYSEGLHGGACFRNLRHLFDRKVTGSCKK